MRYLFLLLVSSTLALGQSPVIDSLRHRVRQLPADTLRVNTLQELSLNYWRGGYDSLARLSLGEALRLAQSLRFARGEARARIQLARIEADYLSDTKTAHAHLDTAERIAKALPDRSLQGQVLFRRAQLYENMMNMLPKIYPLLQQALRLFRQTGEKRWEALIYSELSLMKMGEGNYAEAINLLLTARRLQEGIQDWQGLRVSLPNLGMAYLKINRYDEALTYLAEAEQVAERLGDNNVLAFVLGRRAEIMEKKGHYREALALYLRIARQFQSRQTLSRLPAIYADIGQVYFYLKDYDKALRYSRLAQSTYRRTVEKSQEAFEHGSQINFGKIYLALKQYRRVVDYAGAGLQWTEGVPEMRLERTEYNHQLAQAYEKLGQPAKALYHFKRYKADADTMLNEEAIQKVTVAGMNYEFDKKQQAVRLKQAQQQSRIQSLENDQLIQSRNFLTALLVLSAGILGLAFWSNRRLRAKNEELSRKKAEIEAALFRGQTMERKRVASELHDSVAAKVSALKWRLEALDTLPLDESQRRLHARLLEQMGEVYDDIRAISHNMMPEILEKQGLQAALSKLVDTLTVQDRTHFALQLEAAGEAVRGKTAYELYAITLELVNNILKHANASRADIVLRQQNGHLSLIVRDDGQGVSPSGFQNRKGIGFQNIRSRLEQLGGDYSISSPEAGGTCVTVQVPTGVRA